MPGDGRRSLAWEGHKRLDGLLYRDRWSSARLARELGVTQATVSRYRTGERAPDPDTLARICRLTGLSADEILGLAPERWPMHELERVRETLRRVQDAVRDVEKDEGVKPQ